MLDSREKKGIGDEIKPRYKDEGKLGSLKRGMYSRLKQPISRPRRMAQDVERKIDEDWSTSEEPEIQEPSPDLGSTTFSKYELPKLNFNKKVPIILASIFAFLSFAAAIVYIVGGANDASSDMVHIGIIGPNSVNGGSILELNISVTNNNPVTLELADLIIRYPDGTRVPTDLYTDMTTQRIPLGVIPSGSSRSGTVRAAIFGADNTNVQIGVELEYRAKGSNVLHVAESSHNLSIISNTIDVKVDADKESIAGQQADIAVHIISGSGVLLRDVVLSAEYPFGFAPDKSDPKPAHSDNFWEIGDLAPGEEYILRLSGKIKGQSGDKRAIIFKAGFRKGTDSKDLDVELATSEHLMELKEPFLGVAILYDDLDVSKYTGSTGETIPVEIYWKNNLKSVLSNVVVAASIYGEGVDPYTISADKGFYRSIDSVAIWDKTTTNGALASLPAGKKGNFLLRVTPRVKEQLKDTENPTVNIEIHAAGQRLSETGVPETLQSTLKETVKIGTNARLTSKALFHTNPFVSVGPLPPRVHKETTYAVVWEVSNTTNKMRDVTVTAVLPQYIRWLGVVSPVAENVVYKQVDGTLTWYLGTVMPHTGVDNNEPRRVAFNIGFVPSAGQIGKSPALIINQTLKGIDTFTEQEVIEDASDISTELTEEEFDNGQGTVQP